MSSETRRAAPRGRAAPERVVAWLAATALLFALVYVMRAINHDARDGVAFLYSLPVALLALRFGLRGGVAGALLATGLVIADHDGGLALSTIGEATRVTVLFSVGLLVGWFTDRQRRLEVQRSKDQETISRFFELSQDMLCTADPEGFFVDLNPAWQRTLGYTEEELRAQPFVALVHPDDRERTATEAASIFEDNATVDFENRYLAKDGSLRWLRWSSVLGDDGMIYARATDITQKKAIESKLQETAADLARSNDELKQFAYIASHDLNEPLRTISGFAQLLERRYEDVVDERGRDYIRRMVGGTERMQSLISDLLKYSRAGRPESELEPVDTAAIASAVLQDLEEVIAERGASVRIDPLPTVAGDPNQLHQLFQNLISNGLKFTNGEAPQLAISADREPGAWRFAVADNGIGIEPEQRDRIFGAFERLHSRDEYAGTGIGLAICKKIVARHGGEIHAEANEGGGTRFVFTVAESKEAETP